MESESQLVNQEEWKLNIPSMVAGVLEVSENGSVSPSFCISRGK